MGGSSETTRIVGGAVEFVNKIYDELQLETIEQNECELNKTEEQAIIQTECPVAAIRRNPNQTISVELENGEVIQTLYVVLAAPPRILSERISFHPPLPKEKSVAMRQSETWMAGVTKVALVYKGPQPEFWPLLIDQGEHLAPPRNRRPAFQVYDGTPFSSLPSAFSNNNGNTGDEGETAENKISVLTFFTLASLSNRDG